MYYRFNALMFFYMLNVYQVYFNRNVRTTEWYTLSAGKGKKKKKKLNSDFSFVPSALVNKKKNTFTILNVYFSKKLKNPTNPKRNFT